MAWPDRLREAAYTSPSGVRMVFLYEDVSKKLRKKTSAFNFPDVDGTYIQDLGREGRRYPLRLFFSGADYDLQAAEFENMLLERGPGKLEHPIYGVVDVVPFTDIARRDDLKTAANQAVYTVTFFETTGVVYPTNQTDLESSVVTAVDEYNEAAATQFSETVDLDSTVEKSTFTTNYLSLLSDSEGVLQVIADVQEDIKKRYDAVNDSIRRGMDVLVGDPLTLAWQTVLLVQTPARSAATINTRIDAYGGLIDQIINSVVPTPSNDSIPGNSFVTNDLYATGYLTSQVLSAVNNTFETRNDAISVAEVILNTFAGVVTWRDENLTSLFLIDTGGLYQKLQQAVALAAGYLVNLSFTLRQERILILDRDRTIIDLVAELYGTVDSELDFFINSNGLTGSEIIEIPKGREIVYYI